MTMTREEALTIVTSIVREHSRECREPKPCQDCELEAEAIAALSAQEPVAGWASELELAELQRDMAKNNQVTCIISLASRQSAHKRIPLYAAPPAQADILAEYELWAVRMMVAKTDELNDAAVDKLDSLWRKMTPEQRDQANETSARYSAELQQADTKQAEPCPWVRQSSEGTAYCELAESGAKQAEPLSPWLQALATVNRLHNLGDAIYDVRRYASENDSEYTGSSWEHPDVLAYSAAVKVLNAALATLPAPPALHQLGAKVEVSDG